MTQKRKILNLSHADISAVQNTKSRQNYSYSSALFTSVNKQF